MPLLFFRYSSISVICTLKSHKISIDCRKKLSKKSASGIYRIKKNNRFIHKEWFSADYQQDFHFSQL